MVFESFQRIVSSTRNTIRGDIETKILRLLTDVCVCLKCGYMDIGADGHDRVTFHEKFCIPLVTAKSSAFRVALKAAGALS